MRRQLEERRKQQREAMARKQKQAQQAKAQRAQSKGQNRQQRQATARQSGTRRPQSSPQRPAPTPVQPHAIGVPEHEEVHRMVPDSPIASSRPSRRTGAVSLNFSKLSKDDLRRAFMLKVVLNKPVSVQDPLEEVGGY